MLNEPIKKVQLHKVLKFLIDAETTHFAIADIDGAQICDSYFVMRQMLQNFGSWVFVYPELYGDQYPEVYKQAWTDYCTDNLYNFQRVWDAFRASYNPIDNYNMTEETAEGVKRDKNKATTTPTGTITNDVLRTGLDSATPVLTDKTEQYYGAGTKTETETTPTNTQTADFDGSTSSAVYNEVKEIKHKRSGNIGVTTSAQMLTGEKDARAVQLLRDFIRNFVYSCCYIAG